MPTSKQEAELEYERLRMGAMNISDQASASNRPDESTASPAATTDEPLDDTISAEQAQALKTEGNTLYAAARLDEAIVKYSQAARSAHATKSDRAIYLANRAAAYLRQQQFERVVTDTTAALDLKPGYVKAHARRKEARVALKDWAGALEDAKATKASASEVRRLQHMADEKVKKDQAEAIESLKGLGNSLLSNFGMSLDDISMEKDPSTGSYNIKMKQ